jgi:hypothetical protein
VNNDTPETYGLSVSGEVYKSHLWKCGDCPFETSDRDAFFGHQSVKGWLGHNEMHTMRVHPDVIRYSDQWS